MNSKTHKIYQKLKTFNCSNNVHLPSSNFPCCKSTKLNFCVFSAKNNSQCRKKSHKIPLNIDDDVNKESIDFSSYFNGCWIILRESSEKIMNIISGDGKLLLNNNNNNKNANNVKIWAKFQNSYFCDLNLWVWIEVLYFIWISCHVSYKLIIKMMKGASQWKLNYGNYSFFMLQWFFVGRAL